jgi:hypothetical protein
MLKKISGRAREILITGAMPRSFEFAVACKFSRIPRVNFTLLQGASGSRNSAKLRRHEGLAVACIGLECLDEVGSPGGI